MSKMQKTDAAYMTTGALWNKILLFAMPVAATAILGQLFNAADIAVVGNFAPHDKTAAVAAVGANAPITSLTVSLFGGIALGANVVIATALGHGDKENVKKAVHTSIVTSLLCGILIALIGELAAGKLLSVLNVPSDVYSLALTYLRIYLLGMPVILLYNFEAAIFRSVGDTKGPLIALAASGVLNVLLNLFFVIVLKMTVEGVAISTIISNAVSGAILFIRLVRSDACVRVEFKSLKIDVQSLVRMLKIGLPAGIQNSVFSVSNIVIQSAINSLGKTVMAASGAACSIEGISYNILSSFGQACTTFVGQNYGAGKLKRCRKTLVLCLAEGAVATSAAIFTVLFFGKELLAIFNNNPEVIRIGYTRLMIIFTAHIFSMLYDTMSSYLRGFGISLSPAILTMAGVCGIRIVWIKLAFPISRTFETVMTAYPVSLSATAFLMFIALLICRPSKRKAREIGSVE